MVFITELLLSRREIMISLIEEDQATRAYGLPNKYGMRYIWERTAHVLL